jgi:hypothetical protein
MSTKKFAALTFAWLYQIIRDAELLANDIRVCVTLTKFFNEEDGGRAFPSCKTIGEPIGLHETTVLRSVKRVHKHGHLRVEWGKPGRGSSNQYWMLIKPASSAQVSEGEKPAPRTQVSETKKPASETRKPASETKKTCTTAQENHLENHKSNHLERDALDLATANQEEEQPAAKKESRRASSATFLPQSWQPDGNEFSFALDQGLTHDEVHREADRFRDYWHSAPEAKAKKRDWSATWRNWVRRAVDGRAGGGGRQRQAGGQSWLDITTAGLNDE